MATEQLFNLLKVEKPQKQDDCGTKYCSKEPEDTFGKVLEAANRTISEENPDKTEKKEKLDKKEEKQEKSGESENLITENPEKQEKITETTDKKQQKSDKNEQEPPKKPQQSVTKESAIETSAKILLEKPKKTEQPPKNIKEIKKDAKPEIKPELKTEIKAESKPESKSEIKPETKAETKPREIKPETKPEAGSQTKLEAKSESRPEIKSEQKADKPDIDTKKLLNEPKLADTLKKQPLPPPKTPKGIEVREELKVESIKVKNDGEAQKIIRDMNLGQQGQNKSQPEFKSSNSPNPSLTTENSSQKADIQRAAQFEKVLNTKQPDSTQKSVLNQVKQASAQLNGGKSEVSIALKPESLGRLNLNLISQRGVLTAQITAESTQVRDMLTRGMDSLRQTLSDQGINVGRIAINVQEPASSNNNSAFDQSMTKFDSNGGSSEANANADKQNNRGNTPETAAHIEMDEEQPEEEQEKQGLVDYKV